MQKTGLEYPFWSQKDVLRGTRPSFKGLTV